MEELKQEDKKDESIKKWKLLGSRSSENYLLNIISNLLNNKNDLEMKLESTDLELTLNADSETSSIDKLLYDLQISINSFSSKRDIIKNINKYNHFSPKIEMQDEYYSQKKFFRRLNIIFMPIFHKKMYLDISDFPFYYYNTNKKVLEKYNLETKKNTNKYALFIYLQEFNEKNMNIINDLKNIDKIFHYFENIYIICQANTKEEIIERLNNNKFNKFILDYDNNDNENKIKYIFDILSYSNRNNNENVFNIFTENNYFCPEYFFILNKNNKVISVKKDIETLISKITFFIIKSTKLDKEKKEYDIYLKEKVNEEYTLLRKIINFIINLKKLDYIFDVRFNIEFTISLNDECTDIIFNNLNSLEIEGSFRKKEYNYLENLLQLIKKKREKVNYALTKIETIDIDIDFSDMKCCKCSTIIADDSFLYYCYICKTKYCINCVNEQLKKDGKDKYIDQKHNLVFFKTRNKKNLIDLDKIKFGENRFAQSTSEDLTTNFRNCVCNGCRGHPSNGRYVCLNCRPGVEITGGFIDYCQKCIEDMCADGKKKIELEDKSNEENYYSKNNFTKSHIVPNRHRHDEHVYLFLVLQFNGEGHSNPYQNY